MTSIYAITLALLLPTCTVAFANPKNRDQRSYFLPWKTDADANTFTRSNTNQWPVCMSSDVDTEDTSAIRIDPNVSCKFKILTCSSTSCAKKRRDSGLDEFETYGAFYSLIQQNAPDLQLEESPCLGSCSMAPCVGVEHDDFVGPVSLEGMTGGEFTERV
jgi:hypothetical protein